MIQAPWKRKKTFTLMIHVLFVAMSLPPLLLPGRAFRSPFHQMAFLHFLALSRHFIAMATGVVFPEIRASETHVAAVTGALPTLLLGVVPL
jgi:hypothetical protein